MTAERITADVVGPVCETSDFFLRDAPIERPEEGDLLAIRDAGAYGFAMSSNYNFRGGRRRSGSRTERFRVVRRREDVRGSRHAREREYNRTRHCPGLSQGVSS